ncbi:hypothetical protein C7M51_01849 [Mixta intestinalis]|uniref:Uncharacterized protein n=1 Tax=Mixta intestinalis TaxID=1615494 RepID=A0A6P1Q0K7_9GAMM|nr:hypothetical protein C7M51_01849 [Mixta intestinalis]
MIVKLFGMECHQRKEKLWGKEKQPNRYGII